MTGRGTLHRKPVEEAGQRIGRGDEAGELVAEPLLDAEVDHLLAEAVAVRDEVAARIGRAVAAVRGAAGEFGVELCVAAAQLAEERRAGPGVDRIDDPVVGAAAFEPQDFGMREQQFLRMALPGLRRRRAVGQGEDRLQVALENLDQLVGSGRCIRLDRGLHARRPVVERQRCQQRQRGDEQDDQRAPQQRPCAQRPVEDSGGDGWEESGHGRRRLAAETRAAAA